MKGRNSGAVMIFLGALLTFGFGIGLAYERNPGLIIRRGTDVAWEMFSAFCGKWYIIMGLVGIPMLVISLIVCLVRESRENRR